MKHILSGGSYLAP